MTKKVETRYTTPPRTTRTTIPPNIHEERKNKNVNRQTRVVSQVSLRTLIREFKFI